MALRAARHRRSWKRRFLAGASAAAAAGLAVTATMAINAEAAWTSSWNVSASGWSAADSPQVSVDRQGDALLAWTAGDMSTTYSYQRVQTRVQYASGTKGAIRTLSPDGAAVSWPETASDDTGDSAVVWQQDSQVVGRRVAASGSLVGPLQKLSTSAPATTPVVAVTPGGTAMAAWAEIRDGSWYAVARRIKLDGTVGAPITLGSGSAEKPAIGVDRNGQFVVAWARASDVVARRITSTSVSATKVLTTPIASYGGFGMVRVGVDRDGDAVISYHSGGGAVAQVWASRWSRTGTLAAPLRISAAADNAGFHHALATDLDGDSMIVWTRYANGKLELLGRRLSAGGTRGAVTTLGLGDRPDLALDDDGDGMLVFHTVVAKSTPPYSYTKTSARLVSRSGTFGATKTLTSDGRVPQVDTAPSARFTVVWQQESFPYPIKSVTGP
ncbi:hypothetical protein [Streptomyces sp. HUAS TT20]|uniref:hypothetical protein n=1 Tax=Streptomyces sp. HUAS TT20 TaxID=3447509 RepID=UPI0021D8CDBB|nr:hypothetical protein [Streptomyces sp. HUAS 15-9]UXY28826.1 hypothetical protein N8I87_21235 [Streptomyces sp. HUAS 15-9]